MPPNEWHTSYSKQCWASYMYLCMVYYMDSGFNYDLYSMDMIFILAFVWTKQQCCYSTISEATIWQSPPVRFELHQPLILFRNIRCVCVCFYFGASTIALIPNWLDNNNKSTKYCCLKIKTDQITINFQILLPRILFYRQKFEIIIEINHFISVSLLSVKLRGIMCVTQTFPLIVTDIFIIYSFWP